MYCCIALEVDGRTSLITSITERQVALAAGTLLRDYAEDVTCLGYMIECDDMEARERVPDYPADVALELTQ